jgi:Mn-dependent DtxR family transcriptional regulator
MDAKLLDTKAFEIASKLKDEGKSQFQIAEALTSKGYVTSKGGPITQTRVSTFMTRHEGKKQARKVLKRNNTTKIFLRDIKEVAEAKLSNRLKERMIKSLVEQRSFEV